MKPITFENLRRFMGGGRKKKEKESSFKRSDSFKRISIRKNYLDRGGGKKKQQQQRIEAANNELFNIEQKPFEISELTKDTKKTENIYTKAQDLQRSRVKLETGVVEEASVSETETFVDYNSHDRKKYPRKTSSNSANSSLERHVQKSPVAKQIEHAKTSSSEVRTKTELLQTSFERIRRASSNNDALYVRLDDVRVDDASPSSLVVGYDHWVKNKETKSTTVSPKFTEKIIIHVPASEDMPTPSRFNISAPVPAKKEDKRGTPILRRYSAENKSPVTRTKHVYPVASNEEGMQCYEDRKSQMLRRQISNDSAVEMFPWGNSIEILKLDRSPTLSRRIRSPTPPKRTDSQELQRKEDLCSLSISLGRIWMDAPLAMAPRSLELPRPPQQSTPPVRTTHHSLDSALKTNKDDAIVHNRLQKHYPKSPKPSVSRTLSTSTQNSNTAKTISSQSSGNQIFSSKDSGFSLSISIPKLTEFSSTNGPYVAPSGFFRKKRPKPKLSVSRDGYFKRTSGAVEPKAISVRRNSSRKKKGTRNSGRSRRKANPLKSEMYQVVVNRPPRSLTSLKLDPMIFVAPEKRNPTTKRKSSFKYGVREIRNKDTGALYPDCGGNSDSDEGLYECISGDYTSGEFCDASENGRISRFDMFSADDDFYQFPSSDFTKMNKKLNAKLSLPAPDALSISESIDFSPSGALSPNSSDYLKDLNRSFSSLSVTTDWSYGQQLRKNSITKSFTEMSPYNFSVSNFNDDVHFVDSCRFLKNSDFFDENKLSQRSPSPEYSAILETVYDLKNSEDEQSLNSDKDKVDSRNSDEETIQPILGVSPMPRRKPVRRRKSTVTYLAKPSIHRAPSTLKRNKPKISKSRRIDQM